MDKIKLTGMEFKGYHGCLPQEREQGQVFLVDLELGLGLRAAGVSDDLEKTVNYAEVFEQVRTIVEGEPCLLIEAVAEKIAARVLADFSLVQELSVTVHKPEAPIPGRFRDAAVTITRVRHE